MKLYHKFMSRFSEPYRIRNGWGLSPLRNRRELKALVKFCDDYISGKTSLPGQPELNPIRTDIYLNTVMLAKGALSYTRCQCQRCDMKDGNIQAYHNVYDYVQNHCGWYWS